MLDAVNIGGHLVYYLLSRKLSPLAKKKSFSAVLDAVNIGGHLVYYLLSRKPSPLIP